MIIDEKNIGGYYGIYREIMLFDSDVIIRFNALGNDEIDLEFKKKYATNEEALKSVNKYIKETIEATKDENGPSEGGWIEYERRVNESIIMLFKDTISNTIKLPDEGIGYTLNKMDSQILKGWVDKFANGEYIRFVNYERWG